MTGPLLNYEQAAEYLGLTTRQVRRLWEQRKLAAVKLGRQVRFRVCDLDDCAERHVVSSTRGKT